MTTDELPPTQYLVLEVLAARYRLGEKTWSFPTSLERALMALQSAGLVDTFGSTRPKTLRARLTDKGIAASMDMTYSTPVPTLAQAIDTLPSTNDEYLTWMREHGLGPGAGVGRVISEIRNDLKRIAGEVR